MNTYVQPGDAVTLAAPSGGVVSGTGYLIGSLFVIATTTVAQTLPFVGLVRGVVTHAKTSAQAWAVGALVYWDNSAKVFTTTVGSNKLVGCAVVAADNPSATGTVRLNGAFLS